jgi:hypothetical protein
MKSNLILSLALALSGGLFGCSSPEHHDSSLVAKTWSPDGKAVCNAIIAALNKEDWNTLQKLAPTNSIAHGSIEVWKKFPVRAGKLIDTWENHVFTEGEKPCTVYSFLLDNKDGSVSVHWLQVVVRKQPNGAIELVDFWKFGW